MTYRDYIEAEAAKKFTHTESFMTHKIFKKEFIENCLWLLSEMSIDPDSIWKRELPSEINQETK